VRFHAGSLSVAIFVFALGLTYKVGTWFRYSIGTSAGRIPISTRVAASVRGTFGTLFSAKLFVMAKVFILDVVFQLRILKHDTLRWVMHIFLSGGFLALLLMHALGRYTTAALFPEYASALNPYLFLRDLFGVLVILGVALALLRRFIRRGVRPKSNSADVYALVILTVILLSGILLEAVKISSLSAFDEMVETYTVQADAEEINSLEAFWVSDLGLVSHRVTEPFDSKTLARGRSAHELQCMQCHSSPQWAIAGYATSRALKSFAAGLGDASARSVLWNFHFFACLLGLAYLPFSKMFHIFASPLSLLANAVMEKGKSDPANIATRQIMELDACTHCGACTERCSVAMAVEEIPNLNILPSEKIASIKALVAGKEMSVLQIRTIQQGMHLCTNCGRCTEVCPVGINLAEMWVNVREALLEKAVPEFLLLSPFSLRRGLTRDSLDENRYKRPLKLAREAILLEGSPVLLNDQTLSLEPGNNQWLAQFNGSFRSNSFSGCYRCMTCSNSCPVVRNYPNPTEVLGLLPHQIMHALGLKLWDLIFSSKMLWNCLGCYQCQESCPQCVRVSDILFELKNLAIARAHQKPSSDAKDRQ
jgi:heterodisulfide reductase subunit C/nitrate reductase gamma subunit